MELSLDSRRTRCVAGCAFAAAIALSIPATARADDEATKSARHGDVDSSAEGGGSADSTETHASEPRSRFRRGPIIAGASMFGGPWILSCVVGVLGWEFSSFSLLEKPPPKDASWLGMGIPVLGPIAEIWIRHASPPATVVLVLDGVTQFTGLALLTYGLTTPEPSATTHDALRRSPIRVVPVPLVLGSNGAGLAVAGVF